MQNTKSCTPLLDLTISTDILPPPPQKIAYLPKPPPDQMASSQEEPGAVVENMAFYRGKSQ